MASKMLDVSVLPLPSIQMARSLKQLERVSDLSAYDLFQEQLASGEEAAVDAMKRLVVVVRVSAKETGLSAILTYLESLVPTLSDELLLLLGQQLAQIIETTPNLDATQFLSLLERLAATEETVVRNQAVTVLQQLGLKVQAQKAEKPIDVSAWMALVKRLAGADWFTAKVSAAGVVPTVLTLVSGQQTMALDLCHVYKELCRDDTPMVRRAAAQHLGAALKSAGFAQRDFGATAVASLAHDEQDSVRLLAVAATKEAFAEYSTHPTWTIPHWLPILKDGSTDMSWRVRNNLAKHFSQVATTLGLDRKYPNEQALVMSCFVALLTDPEPEVRAAAVGHVCRMVAWCKGDLFATHVQPLLPALADDVVVDVRSKTALALMDVAADGILDDAVILQALGPLLEGFLQDEFQEVQLQVLSHLHKIAHLLPGLPGVVSNLLSMSRATNWRVRQAIAQLLPHLAEARGLDYFSTILLEPCWLTLLLDPVASVRNQIVAGVALLVRVTGPEFLSSTLLPHHVRLYQQHGHTYLIRWTILRAHIEMALECGIGGDGVGQEVLVQVIRGLSDTVPNVRVVAASGLAQMVSKHEDPAGQVRTALENQLIEEEDEDCRQACQDALDGMS